ncbi:MAG TPA: hypothetical protein PK980_05880, partial [Paludibacteraceae bacterium]|nr:hypothetical protein [Paludibacteraceae bacterium]
MTKNCTNIYIIYFQIFNNAALPQTPLTRKIDVRWLKSSKLAPPSLKQKRFLTPTSLIFSYADRWFGSPGKVNSLNLIFQKNLHNRQILLPS